MSEIVVAALRALREGNPARARHLVADEDTLLASALSDFLGDRDEVTGSVYTEPSAFRAFITGGGNIGLYEATASALAAAYDRHPSSRVLDIGCGDGAALVPATKLATRPPLSFDLVEPSGALLTTAAGRLRGQAIDVTTHPTKAQRFADAVTADQRWDLAESTYALHTLTAEHRDAVLQKLRGHVSELVIIDFDVPDLAIGSDDHLRFLAATYERGLAEYDTDRDLVAQGFLVPVLVGQLAPSSARMTYEQPAAAWEAQLGRNGWTTIERAPLYPYWSSPAFILTAQGQST